MVFTSATFLFLFLPIVLFVYNFLPNNAKKYFFVLSSLVFYGFWRLDFILLLIFSTYVDYYLGKKIYTSSELDKKKFLILSIIINLSLLGYFKYFNFGIESFNILLQAFDIKPLFWPEVILPVGISFFTFQTMSYSIDIYRQEIKPAPNLITFASYVSMFPQLVAGPIVRYKEIERQIIEFKNSNINFDLGVHFFTIGFCKKVFIANNLSPIADYAFSINGGDFFTAFIGILAYSFQIYFDFSGYSDMAIGLGHFFGFKFPVNFNSPYKAISITDYWRRWHISLSSWFRDYLYIPLGGNRKGVFRTYFNLSFVMILCGAWHGAKWTFIIWGVGHGLFLIIERLFKKKFSPISIIPNFIKRTYVIIIAFTLWVPFRADDSESLIKYLNNLLNFISLDKTTIFNFLELHHIVTLILACFIAFFFKNSQELVENKKIRYLLPILFIIGIHEMLGQAFNPFLYFNF